MQDGYKLIIQQKREKKELQSRLKMIRTSIQPSEVSLLQPRMITFLNGEVDNKSSHIDFELNQDSQDQYKNIISSVNANKVVKPPKPPMATYNHNRNQQHGLQIKPIGFNETQFQLFSPTPNQPFMSTTKNSKLPLFQTEKEVNIISNDYPLKQTNLA